MEEMIQLIGTTGPVKNYVDSSKMITFTVDRKYREQLHQVDDLFNTEVVIQIIPRDKAEAMLKEAQKIAQELEQEVEYQEPDIIEQVKKLRWKIHAELMAAGCELEQSRVCEALVGEKRLHHCTLEQTQKIWEFMCDGAAMPSINRTSLRGRILKLIGEEV